MTVSGPMPERGIGDADTDVPETGFDDSAREQRQALVAFAWALTGDVGAVEDVAGRWAGQHGPQSRRLTAA